MRGLFVPAFGAPADLYASALPRGWVALRQPRFGATRGALPLYVDWLRAAIACERRPVAIGGHSMGAALSVLAAASDPGRVTRVLLVAPAGLPLSKPMAHSLRDFGRQLLAGDYPRAIYRAAAEAIAAPRSAFRLAQTVRRLDLRDELDLLRAAGVDVTVVGCVSDTLTPSSHCREVARLAGARYDEVHHSGGHMWMLRHPTAFARLF